MFYKRLLALGESRDGSDPAIFHNELFAGTAGVVYNDPVAVPWMHTVMKDNEPDGICNHWKTVRAAAYGRSGLRSSIPALASLARTATSW